MPKKVGVKKKSQPKKNDSRLRYERVFDDIEQRLYDRSIPDAVGIVRAIRCLTMEVNEINFATGKIQAIETTLDEILDRIEKAK